MKFLSKEGLFCFFGALIGGWLGGITFFPSSEKVMSCEKITHQCTEKIRELVRQEIKQQHRDLSSNCSQKIGPAR